jgi:hypothetical protein
MNCQELQDSIAAWSEATFGSQQDLDDIIDHMIRELLELRRDKYDPENRADPAILFLMYNHLVGGTVEELLQAIEAKHHINVNERIWDSTEKGRRWRKNQSPQQKQDS